MGSVYSTSSKLKSHSTSKIQIEQPWSLEIMYNVAATSKETDTDNWKLIPLLNIISMYKLLFDKTKVQITSRVGTKL